jgi:protein ImuB
VFAVVWIPNFALQSLLRHEPELRKRPVALVEAADAKLSKALVLECTGSAEAASVFPGLTAPQAQARCRELVLKSRSLAAEQGATEILLQTAYAFSPNIENTAPGVCTIDLRGLNFGTRPDDEIQKAESQKPKAETNLDIFTATAAHDNTAQQSFDFFEDVSSAHAARKSNMFFPLTPALSLEERETRDPGPERVERQDPSQSWTTTPPLPEGEGWSEGNRRLTNDWSAKFLAALQQLGLEAQIGIASTPNLALLAARAARPVLVVERVHEFFESLPFVALEPAPWIFDIVKRWGIHTAGAFLALGQEAIAERLGADALEIFHRTSARTIRPLHIVVPSDTFEEQMDFEAQIETLEPLLFVLRRFVEQLAKRIELTYRVVAELQLTLTLESGSPYERTLQVPAPTANVDTLFRMLHTHLENLRTDAPVLSLRLGALPVRAEGQQFGLFESALRDPNHFHETLARLTALFGTDRVGTPVAKATHRPDAFQMKTPEFGQRAGIPNSKSKIPNPTALCLRRFRTPIHADVELRDGRPQFINTLLVSARIKRTRGPWCTSGTWWDEHRWSRQEWDVETEKGELYRLRNVGGDWVLEGIYD